MVIKRMTFDQRAFSRDRGWFAVWPDVADGDVSTMAFKAAWNRNIRPILNIVGGDTSEGYDSHDEEIDYAISELTLTRTVRISNAGVMELYANATRGRDDALRTGLQP